MTGIIVTLVFIAGAITFVLLGQYVSNSKLCVPKWFVVLKDRLGSAISVAVVIVVLLIVFGLPLMLILNGIPILLETLFY